MKREKKREKEWKREDKSIIWYVFSFMSRTSCEAVKQRSQVEQSVRLSVQTPLATCVQRDGQHGERLTHPLAKKASVLAKILPSRRYVRQSRPANRDGIHQAGENFRNNWTNVKGR